MNARLYVARASAIRHLGTHGRSIVEWRHLRWLRTLVAALLILLVGPILLAIAAVILHVDGLPVLFRHYRVGRNGRLFQCLKFRTMYRDSATMLDTLLRDDPAAKAEWDRDQKLTNDPRITPIGQVLRRTSLDELPQLFNVLRGDMALVGPRPVTVEELERYGMTRWHYLGVSPGITGLWQVSGRNSLSYDERVALDRRYIERRSAGMSLGILMRTIDVVIRGHGAR